MSRSTRILALSGRKLKTLRLASSGPEWEWLALHVEDRVAAAIPVFKRQGGVLVAIPEGVFSEEEINAGVIGTTITDLGPTASIEVNIDSDDLGRVTPVLLFDVPAALFSCLKVMGVNPTWADGTIHFREDGDMVRLDAEHLCAAARAWVKDGSVRESDNYLTALEEEVKEPQQKELSPPVLDAVLVQLQNLASVVNTLQEDVGHIKSGQGSGGATSSNEPRALGAVAKLAGKPPQTRARMDATALALPTAVQVADPVEEEDEVEPSGEKDLDQLMKLALLKLMDKSGKKSKRSKMGLALGDSSGSDDEDPLRRLSGAKGTRFKKSFA